MYKLSKFVVIQEIPETDNVLLFSTKTAKFVEINILEFKNIIESKYDSDSTKISILANNEILVKENYDELSALENVRKNFIEKCNAQGTYTYLIAVTMQCNARCFYCFEHGAHHENMSFTVADDVADYIILKQKGKENTISIHWFGGEPLLACDVIDNIVSKLKSNNIVFESRITTNGYLLSKEVIRHAMDYWNTIMVQITFDDIEENYNKIKNYCKPCTDNPFQTVLKNINEAIDMGMPVRIRINYDPRKTGRVEEMVEYFTNCFSRKIRTIGIHPIDSDYVPALANRFGEQKVHPFYKILEIEKNYHELGKVDKRGMTKITRKFYPQCNIRELYRSDNVISRILCKYYLQPVPVFCAGITDVTVAIDPFGDIYPCINYLGQGRKYSSGNVCVGIEQNEFYKELQSPSLVNKTCENCMLLPICQGGCKFKHGRYKDNQACIPIRFILKETVYKAYKEIKEVEPEYIIKI